MFSTDIIYDVVTFSVGDTKAGTKMGKLQLKDSQTGEVLPSISNVMPAYRHSGKINAVFYDGHVKTGILWREIFDPAEPVRPSDPKTSRLYDLYWNLWQGNQ